MIAVSVPSLRSKLEQSLADAATLTRTDANPDAWKDLYEPVFLAREIWMATGAKEDRERFDALAADYQSRLDCHTCTPRGVCRCTFDDRADRTRTDSIDTSPKGITPMKRDPSEQARYDAERRNALAYLLPPTDSKTGLPSRQPTAEEQARFDAAGREYDARKASAAQLRRDRMARFDAEDAEDEIKKKPASPEATAADQALERARKRANHRAANAWRQPLDKEGQMRLDEARLIRDEDEAGNDPDSAA
ncbi:MAG TPA: hypothetical protein VHB79_38810 [Polyangiaceae bacterium]|nr:hypothetical protein [Polyangiaceae bacterium]